METDTWTRIWLYAAVGLFVLVSFAAYAIIHSEKQCLYDIAYKECGPDMEIILLDSQSNWYSERPDFRCCEPNPSDTNENGSRIFTYSLKKCQDYIFLSEDKFKCKFVK